MSWSIYNGEYYLSEQALFTVDNRALCYGDSLFETIKISANRLLNLDIHFRRLTKGMTLLKLEIEDPFNEMAIKHYALDLMNKNGIKDNARLRLQVFRTEGGFYTPLTSKANFILTVESLESEYYSMNEQGFLLGVFEGAKVHYDQLSGLKTTNALPYILAGLSKKESGFDDYLILNTEGNIAEATSSNVFVLKDNIVYTPSLDQGGMEGVMREKIISVLQTMNIQSIECKLHPEKLLEADEVFLTNSINGIRWVVGFQQKRYFNYFSKKLLSELNKELEVS